jgi:hypothetical protein
VLAQATGIYCERPVVGPLDLAHLVREGRRLAVATPGEIAGLLAD